MSIFPSIAIILGAVSVLCFLQSTPAIFSLFYHSRLGVSTRKKADDAALSFVLGVEFFMSLFLVIIFTTVYGVLCSANFAASSLFYFIMSGIFFAESIIMLFFYFRPCRHLTKTSRRASTALFIPRRIAATITKHAATVSSRSDTIAFGFTSCLVDCLFILPVFIITNVVINTTSIVWPPLVLICLVISSIIPLFVIRTLYHRHHNLASIQRTRARLKPHFRFILFISFLVLSIASLNLGIINNV